MWWIASRSPIYIWIALLLYVQRGGGNRPLVAVLSTSGSHFYSDNDTLKIVFKVAVLSTSGSHFYVFSKDQQLPKPGVSRSPIYIWIALLLLHEVRATDNRNHTRSRSPIYIWIALLRWFADHHVSAMSEKSQSYLHLDRTSTG